MIREGDEFGDYEIVARLKGGGMATLYLARRRGASGFETHVAIKVVHSHLVEDETFARMFVNEALLSAQIHHPNVVHVEELREVDGQHWMVMEYVPSCSLGQLMRGLAKLRRRLTTELAVHIAIKVADGLHAAHEVRSDDGQLLGVVHRDVTPENVLLAWQGHVKLIDFGIAKAQMRSWQTTGKILKGKLRYMAPEQAHGRDLDRRTDVYALGICLWEMLTMKRKFSAPNDFAMLETVREPTCIPPGQLVPGLPTALDSVVLKALSAEPKDRFGTARLFRRELAHAVPGALALDAADLSELLHAVMGEQIEAQRKWLAPRIGDTDPELRIGGGGQIAEDEALHTMTVSAEDIELFEEFPSDNIGSGQVHKPGAPPPPPPPAPPPEPIAAAAGAEPSPPPSHNPLDAPPAAKAVSAVPRAPVRPAGVVDEASPPATPGEEGEAPVLLSESMEADLGSVPEFPVPITKEVAVPEPGANDPTEEVVLPEHRQSAGPGPTPAPGPNDPTEQVVMPEHRRSPGAGWPMVALLLGTAIGVAALVALITSERAESAAEAEAPERAPIATPTEAIPADDDELPEQAAAMPDPIVAEPLPEPAEAARPPVLEAPREPVEVAARPRPAREETTTEPPQVEEPPTMLATPEASPDEDEPAATPETDPTMRRTTMRRGRPTAMMRRRAPHIADDFGF